MKKSIKFSLFGEGVSFMLLRKIVLITCLSAAALYSQEEENPSYLTVGAGLFDFHRDDRRAAQIQLEFRYRPKFKRPAPLLGITANQNGSFYIFGGFVFDLYFSDFIVFTPAFAAGYYNQGGGKDLGYPLEFRSALELAYKFKNKARLGIQIYHLSNASISNKNPGEESLLITYGIPI